MDSSTSIADGLARAVLALAGLLVVRTALLSAARSATWLPAAFARRATAMGRALRPGLARRLVSLVVGLGVPVTSTVASVVAAAAPAAAVGCTATARTEHQALARPPLPGPRPTAYVVRPGDTLWAIARRHLPSSATDRDIAQAWPRWYAANRAAIGPDPSMLMPGTRLRSPDDRSAGTPRGNHHRPETTPSGIAAARALAQSLDPDRR